MSYCVPIKDLKDTSAFANMVKETDHPIFVTKNGREEFVVMSTTIYHDNNSCNDIDPVKQKFYDFLARSEADYAAGRYMDAYDFLEQLDEEYED